MAKKKTSLVLIGPKVSDNGTLHRFKVPNGSKFVLINIKSRDITFEVHKTSDKQLEAIDLAAAEDYQILNPETGLYVKIAFKKSEGPFKNIPIVE